MKPIRVNLAYYPPFPVRRLAIRLSDKLSQFAPTSFFLDDLNFYPHVTIYSTAFPQSNLHEIISTTQKFAAQTAPFQVEASGISVTDKSVVLELTQNPTFMSHHSRLLHSLNPLRQGYLRAKYHSKHPFFQSLSPLQQQIVTEFGSINASSLYRPHLSLTRFTHKPDYQKLSPLLDWFFPTFRLSQIALFGMGRYGTCTRIIKTFSLKR